MSFDILYSPHAWLIAGAIFSLRLISWTMDTIRLLFIINNRKLLVWMLGFFGVLAFLVAFSIVMTDLSNLLFIISFITGSATGSLLGMTIEEHLALGFIRLTIISPNLGTMLADQLRSEGFAVTELSAQGRDGMVTSLRCDVLRRQVDCAESIVKKVDSSAFIIANEVRPIRRGFWRSII